MIGDDLSKGSKQDLDVRRKLRAMTDAMSFASFE